MSNEDDPFWPKLGRIGDRNGRKVLPYIKEILRSAQSSPATGRSRRSVRFSGARIGRGRAQGVVAATRSPAVGRRRVIVKTHVVRMHRGNVAVRAHLRYIQRDGVTPDGEPGHLYDASVDRTDPNGWLDRTTEDRHHFRIIVSPEDGGELVELKPFIRDLMQQMQSDLGARLDWVAVDHFNTGHPHTHIVLRGSDGRGKDLVIARDYIAHGMRDRASGLVTRELGPETELDTIRKLEREVDQERFTRLDRAILHEASDGVLTLAANVQRDPRRHVLRMGRLRTLGRLGLAREMEPGVWRLSPDLEPVLRRMGERGDIIKTIHRDLILEGVIRSSSDYSIFDPADARASALIGRVIARGLTDEINDRHYLIVDGVDGRTHYVNIGRADVMAPTPEGAVVAITPRRAAPTTVDPTAVETHVGEPEATRRSQERGQWTAPVVIETLSVLPLERQTSAEGATWLDRELVAQTPTTTRDAGFGREVREALVHRRQWLLEHDLARADGERTIYRANMLAMLRRRELARVGGLLSSELDLDYAEARPGDRVEGVYRRKLDLASGRFALIERSRDFTLVPWRPVLERNLGKRVSGIVSGDSISWTLGRRRSGPSIS